MSSRVRRRLDRLRDGDAEAARGVRLLGEDRAPRVRLFRGARDDARTVGLHQPAPVGLLVVRDLDHVDVDLEPEDGAGERERRSPLARAGLRREARHAFLLVVEGLCDRGVRLVRAGGRDALVLVVDAGRGIERLLQAAGAVERCRPPLAIDRPHLLGDRDEAIRRDLLQDDLHREERREVVRPDRLPGSRVENGRRRLGEVGRDVVPGLRKPALVEDVLDLVGHHALLSLAGRLGFRAHVRTRRGTAGDLVDAPTRSTRRGRRLRVDRVVTVRQPGHAPSRSRTSRSACS